MASKQLCEHNTINKQKSRGFLFADVGKFTKRVRDLARRKAAIMFDISVFSGFSGICQSNEALSIIRQPDFFQIVTFAFQLENEETEKLDMEVGVRGNVYNVSNVEGKAKITPKAQTADAVQDKMAVSQMVSE